jgi:polar amino acid transport system substrate-binding protein
VHQGHSDQPSVSGAAPEATNHGGKLLVCANPNALPFSSKNGERRGFELELGEALAKEIGVALDVGWVIFPFHVPRVDCDILFDSIVDREAAEDAHLRLSRPYTRSGVAIALRSGIEGVRGFGDLKKELRVCAIVGSLASVRLGQKGLPTFRLPSRTRCSRRLAKTS